MEDSIYFSFACSHIKDMIIVRIGDAIERDRLRDNYTTSYCFCMNTGKRGRPFCLALYREILEYNKVDMPVGGFPRISPCFGEINLSFIKPSNIVEIVRNVNLREAENFRNINKAISRRVRKRGFGDFFKDYDEFEKIPICVKNNLKHNYFTCSKEERKYLVISMKWIFTKYPELFRILIMFKIWEKEEFPYFKSFSSKSVIERYFQDKTEEKDKKLDSAYGLYVNLVFLNIFRKYSYGASNFFRIMGEVGNIFVSKNLVVCLSIFRHLGDFYPFYCLKINFGPQYTENEEIMKKLREDMLQGILDILPKPSRAKSARK